MRFFHKRQLLLLLLPTALLFVYFSSYTGVGTVEEEKEEKDWGEFGEAQGSDQMVILPPESRDETEPPIVIWWTPFTPNKRILRSCSTGKCLITHSRTESDNPRTEGFIFYGSSLQWTDLPLPRNPSHYWALLHEESPKNNWGIATAEGISLFNLTSTPSCSSSYPLVTQYLKDVQSLLHPLKTPIEKKSKDDKGLVMYLQFDCGPPSDRDSYVKELMKHVKVDSYGQCLHNRDLPENLRDPAAGIDTMELLDIISQYKFALAIENAICTDYITEKFWRPLYAGTVPIVKGSPTVKEWAPSNRSIIEIDDYASPKDLAQYLLYLDQNDDEYAKYLDYKQTGITNFKLLDAMKTREWQVSDFSEDAITYIDGFECFVCNSAIEKRKRRENGLEVEPLIANSNHYNCQYPKPLVKRTNGNTWWKDMLLVWRQTATTEERRMKSISKAISEGKGQSEVTKAYNNVTVLDPSEYNLSNE